jgi:hypothetical protein
MKRTKQPFRPDEPVQVYWNLHRSLYSVKQRGLVVGHTESIQLENASFRVSEAGRQRVLKEKRKNVHATVVGTIVEAERAGERVSYNPYKYQTFVWADSEEPVLKAALVSLWGRGNIRAKA